MQQNCLHHKINVQPRPEGGGEVKKGQRDLGAAQMVLVRTLKQVVKDLPP